MAGSTPALLLQTPSTVDGEVVRNVIVHPLVLLSVLDHHTRRQEGAGRVIGTLLGRRDGDTVEITNCFAVPHAERGDEVAIGKDFNRQMLALHLRANRKEHVVGWYATALPLEDDDDDTRYTCISQHTSSLIHEFYAGECEEDDPVHLVVDTSLTQDAIGVKAYRSSPLIIKGEAMANMFHEIPFTLKSLEGERIVVDKMIHSQQQQQQQRVLPHTDDDSNPTAPIVLSMEKLLHMLEATSTYVDAVVDGTIVAEDKVGRQIGDTLASVPRIRPEVFDRMFNDSLQDLFMVTYLSNITRTQLTIAEKLNASLGI